MLDLDASEVQRLLTPEQVSEMLVVPVATLAVWRCTMRYNLPFIKVGKHVRYRLADVIAFIEANLRQTTEEAA